MLQPWALDSWIILYVFFTLTLKFPGRHGWTWPKVNLRDVQSCHPWAPTQLPPWLPKSRKPPNQTFSNTLLTITCALGITQNSKHPFNKKNLWYEEELCQPDDAVQHCSDGTGWKSFLVSLCGRARCLICGMFRSSNKRRSLSPL